MAISAGSRLTMLGAKTVFSFRADRDPFLCHSHHADQLHCNCVH